MRTPSRFKFDTLLLPGYWRQRNAGVLFFLLALKYQYIVISTEKNPADFTLHIK